MLYVHCVVVCILLVMRGEAFEEVECGMENNVPAKLVLLARRTGGQW